jgi:DNA helicase HerA-like ATPase
VDATPEAFEQFCRLVVLTMSADRPTTVVVDEVAAVTQPGKAGEWSGRMYRQGRKYGLTIHTGSQRPQEVSKTIYTQSGIRVVGWLEDAEDQKITAKRAQVPAEDVAGIPPPKKSAKQTTLHYRIKVPGQEPRAEKLTLK